MNRGELREYFKDILNRSDCTDAQADRFINFGIRRLERSVRLPPMESSYEYTIEGGNASLGLPSDYLELIGVFHKGKRLTRDSGSNPDQYGTSGVPQAFARIADSIVVYPTPANGEKIVIRYYGEFSNLTDDNSTTAEATLLPDAIIYAGLIYASDFYIDERKPLFEQTLATLVSEIERMAERDEFAGRDLRIGNPYSGIDY
ncbi:hypothetical protein UFOVP730_14 [uncultured Caudovirales phage]|uniref:Uncharacterized protein n=1 Tax=uncultured Caudovirales phage TaxID=2100421 RepID=A0A6J5NPG9_9CAUD|nr:hypothetical protein UFOVP730_14 [uncultured Caudovirales phage]